MQLDGGLPPKEFRTDGTLQFVSVLGAVDFHVHVQTVLAWVRLSARVTGKTWLLVQGRHVLFEMRLPDEGRPTNGASDFPFLNVDQEVVVF